MIAKIAVTFFVSVLVGAVLIIMGARFPEGWPVVGGVEAGAIVGMGVAVWLGWMLMRKELAL